jgi:hypothetical protein
VDFFTFLGKAGNRYHCETVADQVDTRLRLYRQSAPGVLDLLVDNDDRGVGRVDSQLVWPTAVEETLLLEVTARGGSVGPYGLVCQATAVAPTGATTGAPPPGSSAPVGTVPVTAATVTATETLSATQRLTLTVQHLGPVPLSPPPATHIRLLVYYDANNDRQPGPGEGVANVAVQAVDAQGRPVAQLFTNAEGEALFNLVSDSVARVIVPFVPGWSARVRLGEMNNEIVLGLPAVRLPVFLPVQQVRE